MTIFLTMSFRNAESGGNILTMFRDIVSFEIAPRGELFQADAALEPFSHVGIFHVMFHDRKVHKVFSAYGAICLKMKGKKMK